MKRDVGTEPFCGTAGGSTAGDGRSCERIECACASCEGAAEGWVLGAGCWVLGAAGWKERGTRTVGWWQSVSTLDVIYS